MKGPCSECRYAIFLKMKDVDPDLTFYQFLTERDWADARNAA